MTVGFLQFFSPEKTSPNIFFPKIQTRVVPQNSSYIKTNVFLLLGLETLILYWSKGNKISMCVVWTDKIILFLGRNCQNSTLNNKVGLTRLWVRTHHHHPPTTQTFRPLPDNPGSWFSACNPILTQLDDSCNKKTKNLTQIFSTQNFFRP